MFCLCPVYSFSVFSAFDVISCAISSLQCSYYVASACLHHALHTCHVSSTDLIDKWPEKTDMYMYNHVHVGLVYGRNTHVKNRI